MKIPEKFIDLDKIIKDRNPKAYKIAPKFLINRLKKTIHEDDINEVMYLYRDKDGQPFVKELINHWGVKIKYSGLENISKDKKYVFAANHPLGGLDGIAMLNLVYNHFGEVKAIVNDLLLNITNLRPVFTGVNVFGKFSKKQIKEIDELYSGEKQVVVFPAGLVSRKIKREIKDLQWKKSFLSKAIAYKRDIIPVYVEAKNSKFFYNFAKIRKSIGIKFNIELIYLPKEMFRYGAKDIIFKFGKPIPVETFTNDKPMSYWVNYIREKSDALKHKEITQLKDFTPNAQL